MINLKKTLIYIFFVSFCLISCSIGETVIETDTTVLSTDMQKEISLLQAEIDSYKQNIKAYLKENSNLQNELKKANENLKAAEIIIIELSKSKIEKENNTPPQLPIDTKKIIPLPPTPPSNDSMLTKAKAEDEAKSKSKLEAEAAAKAEAEADAYKIAKSKSEADAKAKLQAEADAKAKAEAELNLKKLKDECGDSYNSGDYNDALLKCAELSNKNNVFGKRIMGLMYLHGHGIKQNTSRANELFVETAESGDIWSITHLANNAIENKDYVNAHKWFTKGEILGDLNSIYQLGLFYYNGLGITQDFGISYSKFIKSAELGDSDSQFYIGKFYHFGNGSFVKSPVEKDYFKALEWYSLSADQENNKAQNNIGTLYYVGDGDDTYKGFKPDVKKSLEWFKLASDNGNLKSKTNIDLAQSYLYGRDDKRLSELVID
tara:strand:- start:18653 stop:19951 length:1299 start_codon:yes stop_codon:yes gene_type:complete